MPRKGCRHIHDDPPGHPPIDTGVIRQEAFWSIMVCHGILWVSTPQHPNFRGFCHVGTNISLGYVQTCPHVIIVQKRGRQLHINKPIRDSVQGHQTSPRAVFRNPTHDSGAYVQNRHAIRAYAKGLIYSVHMNVGMRNDMSCTTVCRAVNRGSAATPDKDSAF